MLGCCPDDDQDKANDEQEDSRHHDFTHVSIVEYLKYRVADMPEWGKKLVITGTELQYLQELSSGYNEDDPENDQIEFHNPPSISDRMV
jgi:hypothetical protein